MYYTCFSSLILQNPLYAAAQNGHTAVVEILLKAGASVNKVSHKLQVMCPEICMVFEQISITSIESTLNYHKPLKYWIEY